MHIGKNTFPGLEAKSARVARGGKGGRTDVNMAGRHRREMKGGWASCPSSIPLVDAQETDLALGGELQRLLEVLARAWGVAGRGRGGGRRGGGGGGASCDILGSPPLVENLARIRTRPRFQAGRATSGPMKPPPPHTHTRARTDDGAADGESLQHHLEDGRGEGARRKRDGDGGAEAAEERDGLTVE